MNKNKEIKNYKSPQMQTIKLNVSDIIQVSGEDYNVQALTNTNGWSDYN